MPLILVVDDDRAIGEILQIFLTQSGYEVLVFEDAQPALDTVNFADVDLVITDMRMPTPGEVFIQVLQERGINLPIIVMSGALAEKMIASLKGFGVKGIIKKPFRLDEVLRRIGELLS